MIKGWRDRLFILIAIGFPLFHLLLFVYGSLGFSIINSFFSMDYLHVNEYVGLGNYVAAFTKRQYFETLLRTGYYVGASLLQVTIGLTMALIVAKFQRGCTFVKGVAFFPYVVNHIAVGYIFRLFFTHGSALDVLLQMFGFPNEGLPFWLRDQDINNISLAFVSVWQYSGYSMIIMSGALMTVPNELYEAAQIDGANRFELLYYITLPSIRLIMMMQLLVFGVGSLAEFDTPFIVCAGGANNTSTIMIEIHNLAHISHKVGLASAMTVVLIAFMVLLLSLGCYFLNEERKEKFL